jgi:hypothetical protein
MYMSAYLSKQRSDAFLAFARSLAWFSTDQVVSMLPC